MRRHAIVAALPTLGVLPAAALAQAAAPACPPPLRHSFNRLQDDEPQPLCRQAGKLLRVVNTASGCGFTPRCEGLEAPYARCAAPGRVVMGFPSNAFAQEAGSSAQIAASCFDTCGVRFPMFAKASVTGGAGRPAAGVAGRGVGEAAGVELVQASGRPRRPSGARLRQLGGALRRRAGGGARKGARGTAPKRWRRRRFGTKVRRPPPTRSPEDPCIAKPRCPRFAWKPACPSRRPSRSPTRR
jgi:hypothetical protein